MTDDTLYCVGPDANAPIVKRLRPGTWPGFILCEVVQTGVINRTRWKIGTMPQVPVHTLQEVDRQTTLPGMESDHD